MPLNMPPPPAPAASSPSSPSKLCFEQEEHAKNVPQAMGERKETVHRAAGTQAARRCTDARRLHDARRIMQGAKCKLPALFSTPRQPHRPFLSTAAGASAVTRTLRGRDRQHKRRARDVACCLSVNRTFDKSPSLMTLRPNGLHTSARAGSFINSCSICSIISGSSSSIAASMSMS